MIIERIVIDPAWHASQKADAFIYDGAGKIIVEQIDGCDVSETSRWIAGLSERFDHPRIEVDPAGPGAVILEILKYKIGMSNVYAIRCARSESKGARV